MSNSLPEYMSRPKPPKPKVLWNVGKLAWSTDLSRWQSLVPRTREATQGWGHHGECTPWSAPGRGGKFRFHIRRQIMETESNGTDLITHEGVLLKVERKGKTRVIVGESDSQVRQVGQYLLVMGLWGSSAIKLVPQIQAISRNPECWAFHILTYKPIKSLLVGILENMQPELGNSLRVSGEVWVEGQGLDLGGQKEQEQELLPSWPR